MNTRSDHPTLRGTRTAVIPALSPWRERYQPVLLENLEPRIAPATLDGIQWVGATFETPVLIEEGQGLSTSSGGGGEWMLFVEKGQALVFLTDLNQDGQIDANEITGVSAGDGLKMTSFVDINGDIVTNLNPDGTLTDFDALEPGRDGRVVLDSKIESITIRALTEDDTSKNFLNHLAPTTFSIYGNIYAGGGFGADNGGLILDTSGWDLLTAEFNGNSSPQYLVGELYPNVGFIMTGTATSGQPFSFGVQADGSGIRGTLDTFSPAAGQSGGDIIGVRVGDGASTMKVDPETGETEFDPVPYSIGGLLAGNGGTGARGGDIRDVTLFGDIGMFFAIAGNGGDGPDGGNGGAVRNLADLGSNLGLMDIRSGDGGTGFNGKGGLGGALSLGEFSAFGNVNISLGSGGDGTKSGGHGAGMTSGEFAFTPISGGVPVPLDIITTYREAGDIGTQRQIDFNNDGIGDIIYVTQDPNLLAVKLGVEQFDGFGITEDSPTFFLPAPLYAQDGENSAAVTVGDFDGDGYLDIATASSAVGNRGGIMVFSWNPDLNGGEGGFGSPESSPIPLWADRLRSGGAITDMVTGDFNGDGILDLAFVGEYFIGDSEGTKPVSDLVVMNGSGDGYFYSPGKFVPFFGYANTTEILDEEGAHTEVILQATAFDSSDADSEMIVLANPNTGGSSAKILRSFQLDGGELVNPWTTNGEFTAREVAKIGEEPNKGDFEIEYAEESQGVVPIDFTILDIDGDGLFDVATLNDGGVLVAFKGDASPAFEQIDGNKGILLTSSIGVLATNDSSKLNGFFSRIVAGDFDGDATTTDFAIYSLSTSKEIPIQALEFKIDGFEQLYTGPVPNKGAVKSNGEVFPLGFVSFDRPETMDPSIVVYNSYRGDLDTVGIAAGHIIGTPNTAKNEDARMQLRGNGDAKILEQSFLRYTSTGFFLEAGDGGSSQLGSGGNGGGFGSGVLTKAGEGDIPNASITILVPSADDDFGLSFSLVGGDGGNGFTSGGNGGGFSGIVSRYSTAGLLGSDFNLFAGDGGDSVMGKGGAGGGASNLSMQSLSDIVAGDGGDGMTGGNGGSIRGNGIADLLDTQDNNIEMFGGDGGQGVKSGGHGGDVRGFRAALNVFRPGGEVGGLLSYVAGDGGDAVAGTAGNGGSVIDSTPLDVSNKLIGSESWMELIAGFGGDGLRGGHGGSVSNFINSPSGGGQNPETVSVIAGDGGFGVVQNGGKGGSITNVTLSGTGAGSFLQFVRFIAGQGGDSFGAVGGDGGSLTNVKASSVSSSLALAAGAGGDGLERGGKGGDVTQTKGTSAGGVYKTLVIAGDGGDGYGFRATSTDPQAELQAFGKKDSVGGNGGRIHQFTQDGGNAVSVDLIAGNGGSLINYGTALDNNPKVGKGGSITNTTLEGNAGNIDSDQLIKSYNAFGTPMSDFVSEWLSTAGQGPLDTAVGNVGIVAGAAGNVADGVTPQNGVNGSVTNLKANNIMSMVAGSVDRIAAVLNVSKISLEGTVFGAWKDDLLNPHTPSEPLYYAGENGTGGTTETAQPGGSLIDGAILATKNNSGISSTRVFSG